MLGGTFDERIRRRCETRRLWMNLYLCKDRRDYEKETENKILREDESADLELEPLVKYLAPLTLDLTPSLVVRD